MPIPALEFDTGNLPPGIHFATWDEIVATFGSTQRRLDLLSGLRRALESLRTAGCSVAYLDGSFVTAKAEPGDYDGCWPAAGVDPSLLDPTLLDFSPKRTAQKASFGGEFFIAEVAADTAGTRFLDFFQRDRDGNKKGIIAIDLGGLP
jgi:uncharacterized protein DUF6932